MKRMGFMSSVLLHKHGGKLKSVASVSSKLDSVNTGLPYCLKPVAGSISNGARIKRVGWEIKN